MIKKKKWQTYKILKILISVKLLNQNTKQEDKECYYKWFNRSSQKILNKVKNNQISPENE